LVQKFEPLLFEISQFSNEFDAKFSVGRFLQLANYRFRAVIERDISFQPSNAFLYPSFAMFKRHLRDEFYHSRLDGPNLGASILRLSNRVPRTNVQKRRFRGCARRANGARFLGNLYNWGVSSPPITNTHYMNRLEELLRRPILSRPHYEYVTEPQVGFRLCGTLFLYRHAQPIYQHQKGHDYHSWGWNHLGGLKKSDLSSSTEVIFHGGRDEEVSISERFFLFKLGALLDHLGTRVSVSAPLDPTRAVPRKGSTFIWKHVKSIGQLKDRFDELW